MAPPNVLLLLPGAQARMMPESIGHLGDVPLDVGKGRAALLALSR
jgi:hypothetical protein